LNISAKAVYPGTGKHNFLTVGVSKAPEKPETWLFTIPKIRQLTRKKGLGDVKTKTG